MNLERFRRLIVTPSTPPGHHPYQERFRRLIANEDDGGLSEVDGEIAEIKEVMSRHVP